MNPSRRGLLLFFAACAGSVSAQSAVTPLFQAIASQPNGAIVSDPTIRPMQSPGSPASIFASRSVDLQGNGRPDLVVCYGIVPPAPAQKMPCRVLRPQTDGTLVEVTRSLFGNGALPGAVAPKNIAVGDFNKDGRLDMFIPSQGWDAPPYPGEVNVLLLSNADGTYTDRSSTLPQTPDFSHDACVGDIDGDGNLDIYVGNVAYAGNVGPYFLMGKGDGTFLQSMNRLPARIANLTEKFTACGLVDVDQDGRPDLVLGTHGEGGFLKSIILPNDGAGNFATRGRYELPPGPLGEGNTVVQGIAGIDINRDSKPDLIITSSLHATFSGFGVQVLINRGDGTFGDESVARLGASAMRTTDSPFPAPRFVDLNGDGYMDFYFSNGPPENVPRYWVSNGDGTFAAIAPGRITQGEGFGVAALHFDNDGRVDLVQFSHAATGDLHYKAFLNATPLATTANFTALWWNPAESGWGVNVNHQGNILFATLFTYDALGAPLWLVMSAGALQADGVSFAGTLYRTTGPAFNAAPFVPITAANLSTVGTMSIAFSGTDAATLTYTVNGAPVTKQIRRQVYGSSAATCARSTGGRASLTNYQDLWWKADESGWGVNITHQDQTLFATLFTYDAAGRGLWLVMSAGARQADGSYLGDLYQTSGPAFNAQPFTPITAANLSRMGTMQLRFSDGNTGTLAYSINGASVSKAIARQVFSSPPPSCFN